MKNIILTLSFITLIIGINAQDIEYSYDANGARVQRKLIVLRTFTENDSTENIPQEELLAEEINGTSEEPTEQDKLNTKTIESYSENIDEVAITIYPNPTVGELKVAFSDLSKMNQGSIILYDNAGKQIKNQKINSTLEQLDLSQEAKGNYIMLININGVIKEWTIVKM